MHDTPLHALGAGMLAGVGATLLVSLLSRATFGTMDGREQRRERLPHPAAAATPGEALARASDAGPEGSAGKFALKVGAGLFGRDLSSHARAAGEAVHFAYGTFWGGFFGLVLGSMKRPGVTTASALGLGLWALGPATFVPAMKLVPPVHRYPAQRSALLIGGHLIYGWAVLQLFRRLHR